MALQVNAGSDLKRGDLFGVDPREIDISEELRGRHKPPDEDTIIAMAESMLKYGQRQPVECRRIKPDLTLRLTAGFTRANAARLIVDGFTGPNGVRPPVPDFKLKAIVVEGNDADAFLWNVVENAHRNQTSPIDDAHNQRRLRELLMLSDEEIAVLYRCGVPKVEKLRSLLGLPHKIQDQVHDGVLSVQGALDLLELAPEKRAEAVEKATSESGKIVGTKIRDQVRDEHLADEPGKKRGRGRPPKDQSAANGETTADGTASDKKIPRTIKHVKDFSRTWPRKPPTRNKPRWPK